MAEIFDEENAIIQAVSEKFVELGQEAALRVLAGQTPEKADKKAENILRLLTAYRNAPSLSDDNLESLLYAMRMLSGANVFPPTEPIIGQPNIYLIGETIVVDGGGGGTGETPYRGDYDPASGNPPSSTGGSGTAGAIRQGDEFYATDGSTGPGDGNPIGTVFGQGIMQGCIFKARINGAGNDRDEWWLSQDGY